MYYLFVFPNTALPIFLVSWIAVFQTQHPLCESTFKVTDAVAAAARAADKQRVSPGQNGDNWNFGIIQIWNLG